MLLKRLSGLVLALAFVLSAGRVGTVRAQDESWLIAQTNELRASLGLSGLVPNGQLAAAATQHSTYMATTCDIAHTESNGSTPMSRAQANGYPGSRVNENIYGGTNAQASNAWTFWLNSGVHYQAMVDSRNNEIGIGVASGPCGHFFTMLVGTNDGVSAPPPPALPAADSSAEEGDAAPQVAAAPPTQRPYVPPPPSRTPTPTILTLTPSATWTITPTHTITPTGTQRPPTATPLILPTVPALGQVTAVAQIVSPTSEPSSTPTRTPVPTDPPLAVQQSVSGDALDMRDLLPFAIAGQIVLIGVAGFVYFRRSGK